MSPTLANIIWYLVGVVTGIIGLIFIAIFANDRDKRR